MSSKKEYEQICITRKEVSIMKKAILVLCALVVMFALIGCANGSITDDIIIDDTESVFFTGVITEINDNTALVTPNEGEQIRSSGDAVYVSLKSSEDIFAVGDTIKVEYDGTVMESYPLQINAISVKKVK